MPDFAKRHREMREENEKEAAEREKLVQWYTEQSGTPTKLQRPNRWVLVGPRIIVFSNGETLPLRESRFVTAVRRMQRAKKALGGYALHIGDDLTAQFSFPPKATDTVSQGEVQELLKRLLEHAWKARGEIERLDVRRVRKESHCRGLVKEVHSLMTVLSIEDGSTLTWETENGEFSAVLQGAAQKHPRPPTTVSFRRRGARRAGYPKPLRG